MAISDIFEELAKSGTAPEVKVTTLPASYFKFPPSQEPTTVPPPADHPTLAHPFTIPTDIYNALLSPHVPITIALAYMSIVSLLNSVNANRKYKPWAFSRTRLFKLLIIIHNVFLAAYSAWTCVGMINALHLCLPEWNKNWSMAQTADALCKMHGPRGIGSAATYNSSTSAWGIKNRLFHLAADGLGPDSTDVGRLWNEGLAFYGWLFYLSKFYEVIDTLIILAKGKRSSLLQTYHHAGAMLCMWAGIRYMSPPIWMFVLVNSGIHAVMYTFYLLSALRIRVPKWFKQTLTTLQITQFIVGATYAFLHLFVAYQIPVSVSYLHRLGEVVSKAATSVPSDASVVASSAIATASAGLGDWLKKAVLRGAGYEGLAENVLNKQGEPFGLDAVHMAEDFVAREETRYRDELQWVNCLDTSGQVFAILLNCMYLAPLTWLFVQFFISSYLKRIERRRSSTASETALFARQSLHDASVRVARRLSEAVEEMHRTSEDIGDDAVIVDADEIKQELKDVAEQAKSAIRQGTEKLKQGGHAPDAEGVIREVQQSMEGVKKSLQEGVEKAKAALSRDGENKSDAAAAVQKAADNIKSAADQIQHDEGSGGNESVPKKTEQHGESAAEGNKKRTKPTGERETATKTETGNTEKTEDDSQTTATEPEQEKRQSPNGDGTGAGEATGSSKEHSRPSDLAKKKKEDQIVDESQALRDDDLDNTAIRDGDEAK